MKLHQFAIQLERIDRIHNRIYRRYLSDEERNDWERIFLQERLELLTQAIDTHIETSPFFPAPADIRNLITSIRLKNQQHTKPTSAQICPRCDNTGFIPFAHRHDNRPYQGLAKCNCPIGKAKPKRHPFYDDLFPGEPKRQYGEYIELLSVREQEIRDEINSAKHLTKKETPC